LTDVGGLTYVMNATKIHGCEPCRSLWEEGLSTCDTDWQKIHFMHGLFSRLHCKNV